MTEFPDVRRGSQFGDTSARKWQNLMREVSAIAGMQVSDDFEFVKVGEVMRLSLAPTVRQRQPKPRTVVLVEPFDPTSMVLTLREVRYRHTPPTDPGDIRYSWHEIKFQAFPAPGTTPADYASFLWTELEGDFLKEPQTDATTFLRARYTNDLWIVEMPTQDTYRHCVFRRVGNRVGNGPLYYIIVSWMTLVVPEPPDWPHLFIDGATEPIIYRLGQDPNDVPSTRFTQAVGRYEPDLETLNQTQHWAFRRNTREPWSTTG